VPIERFLSVPAIVAGELVGQIALANPGRPYTDRDLDAIKRLASLYAVFLHRLRTEEAVRKSEARFRSVVEANVIGVVFVDPVTGAVFDANDEYLRIIAAVATNCTPVRSIGKPSRRRTPRAARTFDRGPDRRRRGAAL